MKNPLVTVVLPIYNVEKYLERSINSVVCQTYRNLEIFLVDDESPDHCPQICDEWAKKDRRIRVIHKKNEGQGIARNCGIEKATGEMICFLDSDDYLALDAVEKTVNKMCSTGADLVIFGFHKVDSAGNIVYTSVPDDSVPVYRGDAVLEEFLPEYMDPYVAADGKRRFYMSSCMILYSMRVIRENHWRYVSERKIISEDVYSLLELMKNVKAVAIMPEALYHYCVNETSFSRGYKPKRYEKIRDFYNDTKELCIRLGYSEKIIKTVAAPYISYTLGTLKQEVAADRAFLRRLHTIKEIVTDPVLQKVLRQTNLGESSIFRSVILFCMRNKYYICCYALFSIRNLLDKRKM